MRNPPIGKVVRISTALYNTIQQLRLPDEPIGKALERLVMGIHNIEDLFEQVDGLLDEEGNFHYIRKAIVVHHADYELMLEEVIMASMPKDYPVSIKGDKVQISNNLFTPVKFTKVNLSTILGTGG